MTIAQIQMRRGTAADWASANPTLGAGEWGLETDTGKVKLGTGGTAWNSLDYFAEYASDITNLQGQIDVLGPREIVKFTSSGTFTKASYPWLKYVKVTCIGGGGGGGGAAATGAGEGAGGSGGQSGGVAVKVLEVADLGTNETVTVGAGGSGVSGGTGNDGADTSFGAHSVAKGGAGGPAMGTGSSTAWLGVNLSTTAGTGDFTAPGSAGQAGARSSSSALGGAGGPSHLGPGAKPRSPFTDGSGSGFSAPANGGGGGGGGVNDPSGAARAGGAGGSGIVIVELYG